MPFLARWPGKWSYDLENRKKLPRDATIPTVAWPEPDIRIRWSQAWTESARVENSVRVIEAHKKHLWKPAGRAGRLVRLTCRDANVP